MTPSSSIAVQTNSQLTVTFDTSKTFIRNNDYKSADYTNGTGADLQLNGGALMGRIAATGKVVPLSSAATDGSQYPVGILATDYLVANGATVNVRFCTKGSVVKSKVLFDGTDNMATVIEDKTLEDRIASDTVGVLLIESTENTEYDNV